MFLVLKFYSFWL